MEEARTERRKIIMEKGQKVVIKPKVVGGKIAISRELFLNALELGNIGWVKEMAEYLKEEGQLDLFQDVIELWIKREIKEKESFNAFYFSKKYLFRDLAEQECDQIVDVAIETKHFNNIVEDVKIRNVSDKKKDDLRIALIENGEYDELKKLAKIQKKPINSQELNQVFDNCEFYKHRIIIEQKNKISQDRIDNFVAQLMLDLGEWRKMKDIFSATGREFTHDILIFIITHHYTPLDTNCIRHNPDLDILEEILEILHYNPNEINDVCRRILSFQSDASIEWLSRLVKISPLPEAIECLVDRYVKAGFIIGLIKIKNLYQRPITEDEKSQAFDKFMDLDAKFHGGIYDGYEEQFNGLLEFATTRERLIQFFILLLKKRCLNQAEKVFGRIDKGLSKREILRVLKNDDANIYGIIVDLNNILCSKA